MTLTEEIEKRIDEHREAKNRYPRLDTVAKWLKCSHAEADPVLNEYKRKHGDRIRKREGFDGIVGALPEVVKVDESDTVPIERTTGSSGTNQQTRKWTDTVIDGGALALAVIIDILLNLVVFVTIAPDLLTQIGMGALSFVVVLFGLRGWLKGGVIGVTLWAVFAIVVTFSDLSFSLYVTDVQTESAGQDERLAMLTKAVERDSEALEALLQGYNEVDTGFRSELTVRQSAIDAARASLKESENAKLEYLSRSEEKDIAVLTAGGLFNAIPDAVVSGRWIPLVFFLLIFLGLQGTIIVAASGAKVGH